MSSSTPRQITFVVNDDKKTFMVVIPQEVTDLQQLKIAAANFRHMADSDCSIIYDSHEKAYRLVPESESKTVDYSRFEVIGHAKAIEEQQASQTQPPPKTRIPRPANAWIIYRSQKSKEIRKKLPHATAGYISTLVSQMWKHESREIRLLFNSKAVAAQKLHKEMYPNYKYNANHKRTAK